jgi:tRNA threonylcarbamoyladenosine biosynthesis protein TsaB
MSYILNIETSTKNCSVALAKDGKLICCKEKSDEGYSHAEFLHVFIDEVLSQGNITYKDLSAVAVGQGPGSYTGLRIGTSSVKGLCFSLNIPMIAVDTLQILAAQANVKDGLIIPMIDARRMEVYTAVYDCNLNKINDVEAKVIDENSFLNLQETAYYVGNSNEKCKAVLTQSNFVFLDEMIYPSAKEMSALSFKKFQNNDFVDVAYFEPYYLKDFVTTQPKKQIS